MTNNKVASYAERIERLLDERAGIDADIKDIYTEVKSADLKPKVLRKAIANKRRKVDAQFEADVEEYAALLLALPGATYRGVAEQTGVPKSTLQRRVPKRARGTEPPHDLEDPDESADTHESGTPPHDPETGEIRLMTSDEVAATAGNSVEQGGRQSPLRDGEASADITTASALPSPPIQALADDALAIPAFLRRSA